MVNHFFEVGQANTLNPTDGTLDIYGQTLRASNLLGNQAVTTDASGKLTSTTLGTFSIAGSTDGEIQFYEGGVHGSDSNLTYNPTTNLFSVNGFTIDTGQSVSGSGATWDYTSSGAVTWTCGGTYKINAPGQTMDFDCTTFLVDTTGAAEFRPGQRFVANATGAFTNAINLTAANVGGGVRMTAGTGGIQTATCTGDILWSTSAGSATLAGQVNASLTATTNDCFVTASAGAVNISGQTQVSITSNSTSLNDLEFENLDADGGMRLSPGSKGITVVNSQPYTATIGTGAITASGTYVVTSNSNASGAIEFICGDAAGGIQATIGSSGATWTTTGGTWQVTAQDLRFDSVATTDIDATTTMALHSGTTFTVNAGTTYTLNATAGTTTFNCTGQIIDIDCTRCDIGVLEVVGGTGLMRISGNHYIHNSGTRNMFVGLNAGDSLTTATDCVGVGHDSLTALTSGVGTVCVGPACGSSITTACSTVAMGFGCLDANQTADNHTAYGRGALGSLTAGLQTVAFGYFAGSACTTANRSTFLGEAAGSAYTGTADDCICVNHDGINGDTRLIRLGSRTHQDDLYMVGNEWHDHPASTDFADTSPSVTTAQLKTKILRGTPTASRTYTLPTPATMITTDLTNPQVDDTLYFYVVNESSTNTITLSSSGTTIGHLVVAADTSVKFCVRLTNVTATTEAYELIRLGG